MFIFLVTFAAAIGGLLFGYEIGVISQVLGMPSFRSAFQLDSYIEGLITSTFLLGCTVGAIIVSRIADTLGRKKSIIIASVLFILGGLLQSLSIKMFYIGRIVSGLGIGILSSVVPLFIGETAPTSIRGQLISVQQLMITLGVFLASVVNAWIILNFKGDFEWQLALGIQVIPSTFLLVIMFSMPESPRWLANNNLESECLKTLIRLREGYTDEEIEQEYQELLNCIKMERRIGEGTFNELLEKGIVNRVWLAVLIQMCQQWTGMGLDAEQAAIPFTIANNFVNFIATFPGIYLVDRLGRKQLLVFGGIGIFISHFLVFVFISLGNAGMKGMYYLAICSVYLFIFSYLGVIEANVDLLHGYTRARSFHYVSGQKELALEPFQIGMINEQIYLIFSVCGVVMAWFAYKHVPETSGKSLEEMDLIFGDGYLGLDGHSFIE
ncbi:hypothetical protein HDV01_002336 [Terramyces sp. JEL0728]|nr:hypothetical protein HDV01_002336 [Terramyces sp. JEL0728]